MEMKLDMHTFHLIHSLLSIGRIVDERLVFVDHGGIASCAHVLVAHGFESSWWCMDPNPHHSSSRRHRRISMFNLLTTLVATPRAICLAPEVMFAEPSLTDRLSPCENVRPRVSVFVSFRRGSFGLETFWCTSRWLISRALRAASEKKTTFCLRSLTSSLRSRNSVLLAPVSDKLFGCRNSSRNTGKDRDRVRKRRVQGRMMDLTTFLKHL